MFAAVCMHENRRSVGVFVCEQRVPVCLTGGGCGVGGPETFHGDGAVGDEVDHQRVTEGRHRMR